MSNLLGCSATELAAKIRSQEISPVDAVEVHIRRIEAVNPRINALVTPCFEQAREDAREKTAHIDAHGTDGLPPLFGVPITVKDCWAVEGIRFTGGSWHRRDNIAQSDAESVRLLKDAGAIILGKTNLPDMCWSGESSNLVFGQTNNPHRLNRTAGGSSGGEGAIIAAGGSPLGLGSDIAGSVRIPAAANGCVSLKPSAGRIPSEDHVPTPPDDLQKWNTAGPMARRIEDLWLALSVLSRTPVQDYRHIDIVGRRCSVFIHNRLVPVRKDVVETVSLAAGALKTCGMDVVRNDHLPILQLIFNYCDIFRKRGTPAFKTALGAGRKYSLWREVGAHLRHRGRISWHVLYFTELMDIFGLLGKLFRMGGWNRLDTYRQRMLDAMGDGGVILCPLLVTAPPGHFWIWSLMFQVPYTVMFNSLGFPTVVLPIHYNGKNGLPMAVQIVARPGEDEVALAVAAELERVYGGWQMAHVT
jgi:fatty acid amide hydrolase 2